MEKKYKRKVKMKFENSFNNSGVGIKQDVKISKDSEINKEHKKSLLEHIGAILSNKPLMYILLGLLLLSFPVLLIIFI